VLIDIHVHILPEIDDGAGSLDEAVEMSRCACGDGISAVVATPHVISGIYHPARETILTAVGRFNSVLRENDIPLEVLPGAEYRLEPDLPERLTRGELLTLNDSGRYLLVEMPSACVPRYAGRIFYELLLRGVTPVIAHPERNTMLVKEPSLLYDLVFRGALAQVTAGSLTGVFGSGAARTARLFLEHGCVHFLASDAHSAGGRAPVLSGALKKAGCFLSPEEAARLVSGNPRRAIRGESIETAGLLFK